MKLKKHQNIDYQSFTFSSPPHPPDQKNDQKPTRLQQKKRKHLACVTKANLIERFSNRIVEGLKNVVYLIDAV